MLRAVTFDLDGTLFSTKRYVPLLVRQWLAARLFREPLKTLRGAWAARAYQKARESLRDRGQLEDLRAEVFALASGRCGYPEPFVREVIEGLIYGNPFEGAAGYVFPGVAETLTVLKSRGLKLAVLSDYPVAKKLEALGLDQVGWDLLLSSEDVNALKPHPALFLAACDRLGVEPARALHVGDRPECDVAGAKAAGMKTLLLRAEGPPRRKEPKADYEAASYDAIRVIVEALVGATPG